MYTVLLGSATALTSCRSVGRCMCWEPCPGQSNSKSLCVELVFNRILLPKASSFLVHLVVKKRQRFGAAIQYDCTCYQCCARCSTMLTHVSKWPSATTIYRSHHQPSACCVCRTATSATSHRNNQCALRFTSRPSSTPTGLPFHQLTTTHLNCRHGTRVL